MPLTSTTPTSQEPAIADQVFQIPPIEPGTATALLKTCHAIQHELAAEHKRAHYRLPSPHTAPLDTAVDNSLFLDQARDHLLLAFNQQQERRKTMIESRSVLVDQLKRGQPLPASFSTTVAMLPAVPAVSDMVDSAHHEEHGGGIVLDLDEAVHGTYASVKYLSQVASGSPEAVANSFKENARELTENPLQYVGHELTESGVGEFAAAAGTGVLMLPLAGLAIKAGIEEISHANHELKALKQENYRLNTLYGHIKNAMGALGGGLLSRQSRALGVQLERNLEAKKQALADRKIGFASAASGLTIGLKALSDLGLKISLGIKGALNAKGFFALSESAQAGTTAAAAATGLGIVGTFVLGPLAGVFATALGAFFCIKSAKKLSLLKKDYHALKQELDSELLRQAGSVTTDSQVLQTFLMRQGDKRIGFFKRFARWNKAFLTGSGLYAASAITKAVVTGVAVAGVAAVASNPYVLGVIIAVGVVGAVMMGISSLSFIRGHGKQAKYSSHTAGVHRWVDRALLAALHTRNNIDPATPNEMAQAEAQHASNQQFEHAAHTLKHLNTRKLAVREFMATAANHAGKLSPLQKRLTWWQQLGRRVAGRHSIQRFVDTDEGRGALKQLCSINLTAEAQLLDKRIKARQTLAIQPGALNTATSSTHPAISTDAVKSLSEVLINNDQQIQSDQEQLELTLHRVQQLQLNEPTISDLMQTLGFEKVTTSKKAAKCLLKIDSDIRQARGILFESQLDGMRARRHHLAELRALNAPALQQ